MLLDRSVPTSRRAWEDNPQVARTVLDREHHHPRSVDRAAEFGDWLSPVRLAAQRQATVDTLADNHQHKQT
jgi:hypothetical protein